MSELTDITNSRNPDLSIKGESVERIYGFYRDETFLVNRRYQRKLVWMIDEKRSFIDSIIHGFPVPLILLADTEHEDKSRLEILDGMQRLNAILSFIEGEYPVDGKYFDLETMARTKELRDELILRQKQPSLDRSVCTQIVGYQLPLSIYRFTSPEQVDEVFRRINSNGKHLSRQELRQAGSVGLFADTVRRLAAAIRGDASHSDLLPLKDMSMISITSRDLPYGINVDDVFWVRESILTREYIRESRDEELVADLVAYIALSPKPPSNSQRLDEYYDRYGDDNSRHQEIEDSIRKHGPESIIENFIVVYDEIRKVLKIADKKFNVLMFKGAGPRVPRYYQTIFLAVYSLLVDDEMIVEDRAGLAQSLDGIGQKHINIGGGGGRWSAKERQKNVDAVTGVIRRYFRPRTSEDPALDSWTTKLENILTQSTTEQNLYDFKQGLFTLDDEPKFDEESLEKIGMTLTAIANKGPGVTGYVIVGISDKKETAERVNSIHGVDFTEQKPFFVTGLDHEAQIQHKSFDDYFIFVVDKLKRLPLHADLKDYVLREVRHARFYGKSVLILKTESQGQPLAWKGEYYVRHGSSVRKIAPDNFSILFKRFHPR